jgi:CHASE2 domain-containing sensor protein
MAGLLYFLFINISILAPFEKAFKDFKFTDVFYAERFNNEDRSDKIVLINIKHASRFEIANAIEKLALQKPKAIGLDIIFKEKKSKFTDSILKNVLTKHKNIVTSYYHDNDSLVKNNNYFNNKHAIEGYINLNLENQNTVIRDFIGVKDNENNELAFATQLALTSGVVSLDYVKKELNSPIPINYIGNEDIFLNFDIEDINNSEEIPAIKESIVILGYLGDDNAQFDIEDKHFTPLNKTWVGRAVPDTYGAVIHANILNMLMEQNLIYRVPSYVTYILAFAFTFIILLLVLKLYKKNSLVFDLAEKGIQLFLPVVLLYVAFLILQFNIYINILPIILLPVFGIEMINLYEHLVIYLNKKFKWESQLL